MLEQSRLEREKSVINLRTHCTKYKGRTASSLTFTVRRKLQFTLPCRSYNPPPQPNPTPVPGRPCIRHFNATPPSSCGFSSSHTLRSSKPASGFNRDHLNDGGFYPDAGHGADCVRETTSSRQGWPTPSQCHVSHNGKPVRARIEMGRCCRSE